MKFNVHCWEIRNTIFMKHYFIRPFSVHWCISFYDTMTTVIKDLSTNEIERFQHYVNRYLMYTTLQLKYSKSTGTYRTYASFLTNLQRINCMGGTQAKDCSIFANWKYWFFYSEMFYFIFKFRSKILPFQAQYCWLYKWSVRWLLS